MKRGGTIVVDGRTYYSEVLWEALVAQNIEMGRNQQAHYRQFDKAATERDEAIRRANVLREELDFALEKLEQTIQKALQFQDHIRRTQ